MRAVASRRPAQGPSSRPAGPDVAADDVQSILAGISRGSEEAWRELVNRYGRRIYAMARSRCRSHDVAEEITQSVFFTLAEKLGSEGYAERGRFEPWLFRIVMNRVRDEQRRRGRRARTTPDESDPPPEEIPAANPTEPADEAEIARLRDVLDRLPEADREIIELRHHAGLAFKTIGEMLDEPVGTLLARHHRALAKIRRLLDEPDAEDSDP